MTTSQLIRRCHLRLTGNSLLPSEYNGFDMTCIPQFVANSAKDKNGKSLSVNTQDYHEENEARFVAASRQCELDRYIDEQKG